MAYWWSWGQFVIILNFCKSIDQIFFDDTCINILFTDILFSRFPPQLILELIDNVYIQKLKISRKSFKNHIYLCFVFLNFILYDINFINWWIIDHSHRVFLLFKTKVLSLSFVDPIFFIVCYLMHSIGNKQVLTFLPINFYRVFSQLYNLTDFEHKH